MSRRASKLRSVAGILALVALAATAPAHAGEPYQLIHGFQDAPSGPYGPFTVGPDGSLYGCTYAGGAAGYGTLFAIRPNGAGFNILHEFDGARTGALTQGNCGLVLSGDTLYGTAFSGGTSDLGVVFSIGTDGTVFRKLHDFWQFGQGPTGALALVDDTLFGVTAGGGPLSKGNIYRIGKDGTGMSVLHSFSGPDGWRPNGLEAIGSLLFGTTQQGGANGVGSIFRIAADGAGFQVMHSFGPSGGSQPSTAPVAIGSTLYGTANHTVYKIEADGTGYEGIHYFMQAVSPGGLTAHGGVLYGATSLLGTFGRGMIYRLDPLDHVLTRLHDVSGSAVGRLTPWNGALVGSIGYGGPLGGGRVFTMDLNGDNLGSLHDFARDTTPQLQPFDITAVDGTLYGLGGSLVDWYSGFLFSLSDAGRQYQRLASVPRVHSLSPAPFLSAEGALHGVVAYGGAQNQGRIFSYGVDGSLRFQYDFTSAPPSHTAAPRGLAHGPGFLYGTTSFGGPDNKGSVYRVALDGSGYVHLRDNQTSDGYQAAGVTHADGWLYVAYQYGGGLGAGSLWRLRTDGNMPTRMRDFDGSDGGPTTAVTHVDGFVYGVTFGGSGGHGAIYRMRTDGTGYSRLHAFQGTDGSVRQQTLALGGLTEADGRLYGMTEKGGANGVGTIFSIGLDGSSFTKEHDFDYATGAEPAGELVRLESALYGAVRRGGPNGGGGVFRMFLPSAAKLALTPRGLHFGRQPLNSSSSARFLELRNTGIGLAHLTVTADGEFTQANDCGGILAPGSSCQIAVTFEPQATGLRSGAVTVNDGVSAHPLVATLTGLGSEAETLASSASLYFSPTGGGAKPVRIQNTGTAALHISAIQTSAQFDQENDCAQVLAPGSTCTAFVTFRPSSAVVAQGELAVEGSSATDDGSPVGTSLTETVSLVGNARSITLFPTRVDFGFVAPGAASAWQQITISARAPVTIARVTTSGDYEFTTTCATGVMSAGQRCSLMVRFKPSASGWRSGVLSVVDNAGGTPSTTNLFGSSSVLSPTPTSLSFGGQPMGLRSAVHTIQLTNSGATGRTISTIAASSGYMATHDCPIAPARLLVGASCTISLTFTPSQRGSGAGQLVVSAASGLLAVVPLAGSGTVSLSPSPTSMGLGAVLVGTSSAPRVLTITNVSGQTLPLAEVSTTGDFTAASNCGATLAGGASCTIDVTARPVATGARSGKVVVIANGPALTVQVSATGR